MTTPQRLPIVNSDDGTWGDILRQYLKKEHYDDGTDNAVNGGHQFITIRAGVATSGGAPLKFTSGTLLSTPEAGAIEFNNDSLYFTQTTSTTRKTIAAYDDASGATGDIYYRNSSGYFTRLGIGSTGTVLTVSGGIPSWSSTIGNTSTITVKDTNFTLQDNTTTSKQLQFELSGISASTTRTLTVPDADTTIVGTDAAQTLTNKTISGSSNTLSNIALTSLASAAYSSTPTASTLAEWDANKNLSANALIPGFTTTVTSATPVTMTIASTEVQEFTGSTAQTVKLPTTSVAAGAKYTIINSSTNTVTVQSSGANTIATMIGGTNAVFTALVATPTTAANWNTTYSTDGDVISNTSTSVDSEVAIFSGTGGKTIKRATGTGLATLAAGVLGAVAAPTGTVVGTSDAQALTNKDLTGAGNTFPTFNQNTTGSAAKWTTARNLAGNSVDGSANVAFANKFIVQGTTDAGLSGAQFLGALGTGLVKNTTSTGVLSIATSGTDYAPATATTSALKGNGSGGFAAATLNDVGTATGDYSLGTNKLTNVKDPTSAQDAATKAYVDAAAIGIDWKPSVRVATTAAGTLATSFANGQSVDGITLATNDRILIKNQATGSENGIYVVAASGAPTRSTDADSNTEVTGGMAVFIEEGTTNADTAWVLTNNGAITLGTTALTFTQFAGLGTITAGAGLSQSGNTISIENSGVLTVSHGGTGANTLTGIIKGNGTSAFTAVTAPTGNLVGDSDSQTLANKTLTTPTIASFTNATHSHTNAAGGGQLNITSASNATGTPSSSTYLRGDNTWATVSAGTSTPTASTTSQWDSNTNMSADTFISGETFTTTSGGTLTMTINSTQTQTFTGSSNHTVKLPTTSVIGGQTYTIINLSSGTITVTASDGTTITALASAGAATFVTGVDTPTTAGNWAGTFLPGGTTLSVPAGGASTAATASSLTARDASGNVYANSFFPAANGISTSGGTTTLTVASEQIQKAFGTSTHTIKLPTTSVIAGNWWWIFNDSTQAVTVQSSNASTIVVMAAGTQATFVANIPTPVAPTDWELNYSATIVASGKKLSASNSLTLAGTDGTTMTFPSTSATIARTDAGNTFTGHQTIEGVTSTGATGTGKFVFDTSPTLVTPNLGTPSAISLTNASNMPISGVTGLGTNVATFLATPSSGNLASAVTGETGTGALVFGTSPTLATPTVNGYTEGVVNVGTVTSSSTLSISSGTVLTATLTANTACTFTMPTAVAGQSFVLMLKQPAATGNGSATFTGVKWNGAGTPTITTTAGQMDTLNFFSDGTNWYGSYSQGYTY